MGVPIIYPKNTWPNWGEITPISGVLTPLLIGSWAHFAGGLQDFQLSSVKHQHGPPNQSLVLIPVLDFIHGVVFDGEDLTQLLSVVPGFSHIKR